MIWPFSQLVWPAGEAQYHFQNLRTQELPVTRGHRMGLCLPGRQDGFSGTALVPVAGRETLLSCKSEPRVLAPFFHGTAPVAHGRVFLFLWVIFKCLVFRVEMFISYWKCRSAGYRKAQRNTYSMYPEWKEWVGKTKSMSVTRYGSQSLFLPTWIHSKKIQNPSLPWNVHFGYRK